MKFKKIIEFSLRQYNDNKMVKDCFPQDGVVINVYFNKIRLDTYVAVGFAE